MQYKKIVESKLKTAGEAGYITLMLVMIVGGITAATVLTALWDGVTASQAGIAYIASSKARSYADACAEKALYRVHNGDVSSPGSDSGSITFADGSCTFSTTVALGGNVTISGEGVYNDSHATVSVQGSVSVGVVTISSWE